MAMSLQAQRSCCAFGSQAFTSRHVRCHRAVFSRKIRCNSSDGATDEQPADLIRLTIKKPLGLVLAERKETGEVFVEEINPNGNAAATGQVQVGDVVVKTSAIVLKKDVEEGSYEAEGYGQRPYTNWETIEFDCAGQDFSTVMAAIGSNNERWGIKTVTLTLRREKQ